MPVAAVAATDPKPTAHRWTSETAKLARLKVTYPPKTGLTAPLTDPAPIPATQSTENPQSPPQSQADDGFTKKRLVLLRRQLNRIDGLIAKESDPGKLDRLAAASSKLEEQERRLSDRSLPAVRRQERPGPRLAMFGGQDQSSGGPMGSARSEQE